METSVFLNDTPKSPTQVRFLGFAVLSLLQFCLPNGAHAETPASDSRVAVPLSDSSRPAVVKATLINGAITVKGYAGKEVVVEAHPQSPSDANEEAKSADSKRADTKMKRIPIRGVGLSVEEENNRVHVSVPPYRAVDLSITVPVHSSLILRTVNGRDISVAGVDGELDVDNVNGSVTLTNVSGTVVAHALNGRVLVNFNKINREKPMSFSSLNGDIDVTFPADLKANVTLSSDRGEVYSDFDVQLQKGPSEPKVEDSRGRGGKYRVRMDSSVRGTINGGGQEIKFKNVQGNIYLRKAGKQ
jgi:DUF4097 and DUF4098 domain-containing protein YvlB